MNADDLNLANLGSDLDKDNPIHLAKSVKSKLETYIEGINDPSANLPPEIKAQVESLKKIQSIHNELETKFIEERAALEAKYQFLYKPLYTKRFEIVNGILGGSENHMNNGKPVPEFWVIAMTNNKDVGDEITERDEEALKYLRDVRYRRIDDPKGFVLEFLFDANPYFTNTVLTKTYHLADENNPLIENAIGTDIEWCPGKCLTQKTIKRRAKLELKNVKAEAKTEECPSFFKFFSPPRIPNYDEDLDKDAEETLQNQMEQDYELACVIREKIIPHAVTWFTGEGYGIRKETTDEEQYDCANNSDGTMMAVETNEIELKDPSSEKDKMEEVKSNERESDTSFCKKNNEGKKEDGCEDNDFKKKSPIS